MNQPTHPTKDAGRFCRRAAYHVVFVQWATALALAAGWGAQAQVDDDYTVLASALSSPLFTSVKSADHGYADAVVLLRMEIARQKLREMVSPPPGLGAIRDSALRTLDACHRSMERLRELDKYMPDIERLARDALKSTPALYREVAGKPLTASDTNAIADLAVGIIVETGRALFNAYEMNAERRAYRSAYDETRRGARLLLAQACAAQYRGVPTATFDVLKVDLDGSWNNTFDCDWLSLRNDSGKDLTKCTILVELDGWNAKSGARETDSHVHYINRWPADMWLFGRYMARNDRGIADNESVDTIETVTFSVYSEQYRNHITYAYVGKEFDTDVERFVKQDLKPKFTGGFRSYDSHLIFDNGFHLAYEGTLTSIPLSYVTVKIIEGTATKAIRWSIDGERMSAGSWGKTFSDERFNGWNPDKAEITLEFPHSDYHHVLYFDCK